MEGSKIRTLETQKHNLKALNVNIAPHMLKQAKKSKKSLAIKKMEKDTEEAKKCMNNLRLWKEENEEKQHEYKKKYYEQHKDK